VLTFALPFAFTTSHYPFLRFILILSLFLYLGEAQWSLCVTCGAWLALQGFEHISFHYNRSVLLSVVLPSLRGIAEFFLGDGCYLLCRLYREITLNVPDDLEECPRISSPVLSCPILYYTVLSCPVLSCPVLSYPVLSYTILSCPVLYYPILSHPIPSYLILSHPILSYPIPSYLILSHPILSHPILSYPIPSYPILYYPILSFLLEGQCQHCTVLLHSATISTSHQTT
jgi:hypothetical protein